MKRVRADVPRVLSALLACCLAIAAGCAREEGGDANESEESMPGDGDPGAGMAGRAAPAAPSFGEVYEILAASCGGGMSGCHITGMSATLALPDPDRAHAALVGVMSTRCPGESIVLAGDADASVLVVVLEGGAGCVKAMPLGRDALPATEIAMIRAWIDAGAAND